MARPKRSVPKVEIHSETDIELVGHAVITWRSP